MKHVLLLALLAFPSFAHAACSVSDGLCHDRLDISKDGLVSRTEVNAYLMKNSEANASTLASEFISKYDLSLDGMISESEYPAPDAALEELDPVTNNPTQKM